MSTRHPQHQLSGPGEQLLLLSVPDIPLQFRLNEQTRRLGLANVANIKAQLAAEQARRLAQSVQHQHPAQAA